MIQVTKRNGTKQNFNRGKIVEALRKAFNECDLAVDDSVLSKIAKDIKIYDNIEVETIQDEVETSLMKAGFYNVAKAYIKYRYNHNILRKSNTTDKTILDLLDGNSEYWNKENANKRSYLSTTQHDYLAGITSKDIVERFILDKKTAAMDKAGIIHIHDKDYRILSELNCCLINLKDMLDNGTVVNGYKINSPHRFLTACTIATQIILGVSSSQYGGCTISTSHLAPYLRKSREYFKKNYPENWEKLYKKELTDGVQTFNYQVNSMSNSNGQSPFLSVALYINEDPEYITENVEIIKEFLKQRIQGLQNEKGVWVTPAFPKLLYFLDENNIKGGEYYWLTKLAAKCTAKRLVPDYISVKKMKELKNDLVYPCMGCRSFLAPWYDKDGKPQSYGRTNLGVITLNLVDVALSSGGDWNKFWKIFDERMDVIHKTHLKFINILKNKPSDVAPILWQYGALTRMKPGEKIGKVFDGTRTSCSFGYAGLYECVLYMTGKSHSYGIGFEKGIEIMKHFNDLINKYKDEDNIGYSPYGSPIESTTYKFAQCLKDRFGIIKGITDHDYITNSYHINVREHIDPFKKLKVEAEYQKYSLGGCISYIESSDMQKNPEAVLEIIDYIYNTIMYAEINSKSDYCCNCGYSGEQKIDKDMNWYCPNCGCKDPKKLYHARRVCGYIGVSDYNKGRTQEIKERFVHLDNHNEV